MVITIIVSNSDIYSFQKCERKFYYERVLQLRPKEYPEAMEIGTFGHKLMEEFFTVILNGGSYEDAAAATGQHLIAEINRPERTKIYRHVLAFGAYFLEQPWKLVALEEKGSHPVAPGREFGFTPDLILEWTMGPKRGQLAVMDFKFTGQYWNDKQINMFQQVPKYIAYKNDRDGTNIRMGGVVMLNTRATAKDSGTKLFLVKWVPITKKKLDVIRYENEILVERVAPFFKMPPENAERLVVRTVDHYQCKLCWFADDLCPMDLNGQDTSRVIERNYILNDYGYGRDEIIVKEDEAS